VNAANKPVLTKSLSTVWRIEPLRLRLEQVQGLSDIEGWNVHHNIQKSDGGTCIGYCLEVLVLATPENSEYLPDSQTKHD